MSLGYCSLDEAWGTNTSAPLDDSHEVNFDTRMESVIEPNEEKEEYENKIYSKHLDKKKILDTLERLEKRILKLEKLCKKNIKNKNVIENFTNNKKKKNYLDYIVLFLMGIIIIYVLDSVFNMGKRIASA